MKEVIFKYGCEGGGETLYREQKNGTGILLYYTEGSDISINEKDEEELKTWKKDYASFEDFWQNSFIKNDQWYLFYVLFIHDEIKPFIIQQLAFLNLTERESKRLEHTPETQMSIILLNYNKSILGLN